jgi:hypothetical protein
MSSYYTNPNGYTFDENGNVLFGPGALPQPETEISNQNQSNMDYSELKPTKADAKHFVLMMLAVIAGIWVMQKM